MNSEEYLLPPVRVEFDAAAYTVEEGASVDVVARVIDGTLARGLLVTTTRTEGTAEGIGHPH